MKKIDATDAARVELMLGELRLPGIKMVWAELAARADKEGWPAARFLAALAEYEVAERSRRRIARNMSDARLPVGKPARYSIGFLQHTALSFCVKGIADGARQSNRPK